MNALQVRQAFLNQCGQSLIVDLSDFNTEFLKNLNDAIKHVMAIACSIRGGIRIPAFELSILTSAFTKIYELDAIRGNFNKIMTGLNSLPNYCQINENITIQDYKDNLFLAINSSIQTFKLKLERNDWKLNVPQIEITIITMKSCERVRQEIEAFIENMEVGKVHKIRIIELQNSEQTLPKNEENSAFVETIKMNGDIYTKLKVYFKKWLLDQCNDIDIVLHFLGPLQSHLTIKCDVQECVLNPLSLPFGHRFNIQVDSMSVQLNSTSMTKLTASNVPVYELNILARVNSSGICESSIFGLPHCLRPTQSWRLTLEEQLRNEQYFTELCRQLINDENFLLARLRPHYQTDQFLPYFLLVPGDCNFLIKSFATSDLTLPWEQNTYSNSYSSVSLENSSRIFSNLQNLNVIDTLDTTKFNSGLLEALTANLEHAGRKKRNDDDEEQSVYKKLRRTK